MDILYKVTNPNRTKKVLVCADTLEELISEACIELDIEFNLSCKVVLEGDGTFIHKYRLLQNLLKRYPNLPLLLMIVYDGAPWKLPTMDTQLEVIEGRDKISSKSAAANLEDNIPSEGNQLSAIPWNSIVPKKLKNIETNPTCYVLEFIRNIADYMVDILQDETYSTSLRMAQLMVDKFPKVFVFSVSEDNQTKTNLSTGVQSLRKRIYDRVNKNKKRDRKRKIIESDEENISNSPTVPVLARYGKNQDSYGCVAYEPGLPENESEETQDKKKEMLLLSFTNPEISTSIEEVKILLNETYPSQRICLNRRDQLNLSLKDILSKHWPHLTEEQHFFHHASLLIGKNVFETWIENVEKKIPSIYDYFRDYCNKYRRNTNVPEITKKIESVLIGIKNESRNSESQFPKTIGFISLLATYFNEEPLFTLVDTDATDEEIQFAADSSRPVLIIKGQNIYESNSAPVYIIVEQTILMKSGNILNGILLLVLCHYVYGYNYHFTESSTLEFIQRMLLDINPGKGSKRQKKYKTQKTCHEDPRTVKLINNIVKFVNSSV